MVHGFRSRKNPIKYSTMNMTCVCISAGFVGFGINSTGIKHCKQYMATALSSRVEQKQLRRNTLWNFCVVDMRDDDKSTEENLVMFFFILIAGFCCTTLLLLRRVFGENLDNIFFNRPFWHAMFLVRQLQARKTTGKKVAPNLRVTFWCVVYIHS